MEQQDSGTSSYLTAITYGQGKYVVVGIEGTIFLSNNGLKWKEIKIGNE